MMFLSKLILNLRSRHVRRDLSDCQSLHRTLLKAFPQTDSDTARAAFGLLFRLETNARTGLIIVLAQSHVEPDWSRLPADYLAVVESNSACKTIAALYESLSIDTRLSFRLRANPTRKIETKSLPDGTKRNGKRVELNREADQIAWLQRKALSAGFRVLNLRLNTAALNLRLKPEGKTVGWRMAANNGQKRRLTFGSVLFEGVLEITNVDDFKTALARGIGSGKTYGFGLISVATAK